MMRSTLSIVPTLLLAAQLQACGGESTASPAPAASSGDESAEYERTPAAHEKGSGSVAATIGEAGGTLELNEGPRVVIPAGALSESQDYVLQTATLTTAFHNEEAEKAVGPTFVLSPGLDSQAGPIEVSFPLGSMPPGYGDPGLAYEYGVGNRVGAEDSQHTRWQYENARYEGGRLVAKVSGLAGMRLQFVITNLEVQ